jgi:hypothetical protein
VEYGPRFVCIDPNWKYEKKYIITATDVECLTSLYVDLCSTGTKSIPVGRPST